MANDSVNYNNYSSLYNSWSSLNITMMILYFVIVVVGISGNSLVVAVVYKTRSMHTTTNVLLANVAVADIISLVWCPIPLVVNLWAERKSGAVANYICKLFTGYAVTAVTVVVTFLSLVVLAVERYNAIVKPLKNNALLRYNRVFHVIVVVWILAIVWSLPAFILSEFDEDLGRCLDPWTLEKAPHMTWYLVIAIVSAMFFSSCLFFCYFRILKGIYIDRTVCSANTALPANSDINIKRKLAIISLTVTGVYYLCYAPFLVFEVYISFKPYLYILHNYTVLYNGYRIVGFMMYANSCLNPFFYAFQSSNYRQNLKRLFVRQRVAAEMFSL